MGAITGQPPGTRGCPFSERGVLISPQRGFPTQREPEQGKEEAWSQRSLAKLWLRAKEPWPDWVHLLFHHFFWGHLQNGLPAAAWL